MSTSGGKLGYLWCFERKKKLLQNENSEDAYRRIYGPEIMFNGFATRHHKTNFRPLLYPTICRLRSIEYVDM